MLLNHLILIFIINLHCGTCKEDVIQTPPILTAEQGHTAAMSCEYTDSTFYSLQWFKQILGRGLVSLLILRDTNKNVTENRYTFVMKKDQKLSIMFISNLEVEDSAVYWCGLNTGFTKLIFGKGTKLHVHPKTDRTMPLVYQLTSYKPKEGLPDTVCLVTDFPSPNKTLDVDEQIIKLEDKAVLDKSSRDVWRYSAVIWGEDNPSKNLNCIVKYDGETVLPEMTIEETTDTCSSLTVTGRFHTNPGMNTLSISVLGLRILTAKAIVFNLIITLRLWSS